VAARGGAGGGPHPPAPQPVFSAWDRIFQNPLTTAAAIDWVVHHGVVRTPSTR
jgi:hypothetical protein